MSEEPTIGIGIDLGTSTCAVSVVNISTGRYEFSEAIDLEGLREIPSLVYVDSSGDMRFGASALGHSTRLPDAERVLTNLKLLLRNNDPISLPGLEHSVTPVELIRGLLSFLKKCFSQTFNAPCETVVITRPAYSEFDVDYRHQIREAVLGDEPLFDSFTTLEEPDAVLLSLGSLDDFIGKTVLVFDMGGGTLDIAIRSVEERENRPYLELLAIHGSSVAGRHLTEKVADHLFEQAILNGMLSPQLSESDRAELFRTNFSLIDRAKRVASSLAFQADGSAKQARKLKEPVALLSLVPGEDTINTHISVADFNKILQPFIAESLDTVKEAVAIAGLLPDEIDAYYIVGGGSQILGLAEALTEYFGRKPESLIGDYGTIDPRLAVSRGAAVWALARPTDDGSDVPSTGPVLERRLPYAISQVVNSGRDTFVLFDEGTLLPAEGSSDLYAPIDREKITIKLVRGMGSPTECVSLADTVVDLVERAGIEAQALKFSYALSLDGELTLLVKDWKERELPAIRFGDLV